LVRVVGFSGRDSEGVNNVAVDSQNNVVISGYFQDDNFDANPTPGVSFDLTPKPPRFGNAVLPDTFVEKLSGNLRMQWVEQLAGDGNEFADQLKIDSADNIVIGGSFYGEATFGKHGPTITSVANPDSFNDANDNNRENSYDPFVWKIAPDGITDWAVSFGAASDDFGAGIGITADDSILFTGRFRNTTDFNTQGQHPRLRGLGLADAFITGFDANGVPLFDLP
ncbi:MAG TPA: hypothetical protein VKK61_03640, partial [Tepidisphaeraceae bacterium]|nr:hypothetical protein [Tepidisphaeraceae bacterium]